jgi:hypothetical protein
MLKTSPARRDFVERLPQREALLDALAFSAISIGRSTERAKNMVGYEWI